MSLAFQEFGWFNAALEIKVLHGQSIDCYDANPVGEATFYDSHKITVLIWPVGPNKVLSTLDALGV